VKMVRQQNDGRHLEWAKRSDLIDCLVKEPSAHSVGKD